MLEDIIHVLLIGDSDKHVCTFFIC